MLKSKSTISVHHQLEQLGARLATIRLSRNMTQAELADKAHAARHTIMRLEKGESVSLETFLSVMNVLGLSDGLVSALPDPSVRPVERVLLRGSQRQRARGKKESVQKASQWAWNEEVEE